MRLSSGATRSVSLVSVNKIVQVAGLAVTVALVPRLFGAEAYGRFAFVLSLSYLGQILGDFGTLDVLGRFVPSLPPAEAARLYTRTLAFKLAAGAACGLVTAGAALAAAPWMRPEWAGLVGLGVALHVVAWVPFQFALGLSRVGTWMAEQAWRQWVLLLLLLVLLPPLGLGGALLALLAMELLFCGLGCWWVRDYWRPAELRLDWPYLRPYVRFGAGFFLANLVAVALYRSGPALVELLSGSSSQTGYFNLALGLFMLAYITLGQFAQGLIPALSSAWSGGQSEVAHRWLRGFCRYGWLAGWLGALAVWLLAGWGVPLVFGPEFAPAAAALRWISLGLPPAALLWAASVLATVTGSGRARLAAALVALLLFLVAALALVPPYGAAGAALALVAAVAANVAVLAWTLRPHFTPEWGLLAGSALAGSLGLVVAGWLGI